jgi:hypothetical protein
LLGVSIGVLSVLALAAYEQYASAQVASILSQFGSNLVTVTPTVPQTSGARVGQVRTLTVDDASAIRERIPELAAVTGVKGGCSGRLWLEHPGCRCRSGVPDFEIGQPPGWFLVGALWPITQLL